MNVFALNFNDAVCKFDVHFFESSLAKSNKIDPKALHNTNKFQIEM